MEMTSSRRFQVGDSFKLYGMVPSMQSLPEGKDIRQEQTREKQCEPVIQAPGLLEQASHHPCPGIDVPRMRTWHLRIKRDHY